MGAIWTRINPQSMAKMEPEPLGKATGAVKKNKTECLIAAWCLFDSLDQIPLRAYYGTKIMQVCMAPSSRPLQSPPIKSSPVPPV